MLTTEAEQADVLVVGAGAAGLMAAIHAGRAAPGRVVLLDGAPRLGAKILISGGGRCNVTNAHVSASDFNGGSPRTIARVLKAFPAARTRTSFAELGVALHEEARGKLFPDSERARTVLDALLESARRAGVTIVTGQRVERADRSAHGFSVGTAAGAWDATRLVLATGGRSVPRTGSDGHGLAIAAALGHSLVETTPALVPLVVGNVSLAERLAGVAHEVVLELVVDGRTATRVSGPMLWTHTGLSGPAALDVSRHWHRAMLNRGDVRVQVNVCGGRTFDEADRLLAAPAQGRASVRSALEAWMPASVARAVLDLAQVDASGAL